jgi:hypothetical protein
MYALWELLVTVARDTSALRLLRLDHYSRSAEMWCSGLCAKRVSNTPMEYVLLLTGSLPLHVPVFGMR